jgi:uncharacterized membrane protein YphA (DoxX/SURF4 family)
MTAASGVHGGNGHAHRRGGYSAAGMGSWAPMTVLRFIARPMLGSIFVIQGYETWRRPERVTPAAEPVVGPVRDRVPGVPSETEESVRLNGAIQAVAGSMLAAGWFPRLAALALAGTLVPTTLAGHRFWEVADKQERAQQRIHFLKNVTIMGGLLIAAADTGGSPSLAWRGRHAARTARREASLVTKTARVTGKAAARTGRASSKVSNTAGKVAGQASLVTRLLPAG